MDKELAEAELDDLRQNMIDTQESILVQSKEIGMCCSVVISLY
jgi:hypothetical protein